MAMGTRIKERLDELGWQQVDLLARVPELDAGSLSALIKRDSRKSVYSDAIAEAIGVTHRWLVDGFAPKLPPSEGAGPARPGDADRLATASSGQRLTRRTSRLANVDPVKNELDWGLPMISWEQAAHGHDAGATAGDAPRFVTTHTHGPRSFALRVRGDSMLCSTGDESFRDGDVIFVDPDREPRHRSLVIVTLPGDTEATFRQLLIDGPRRYLQALNPQWPDRVMQLPADARICGVVFALDRVLA